MHSAALIAAKPAWSQHLYERLQPGSHVVLLTSDEDQAIEARRAGFELRDTLLVLWPQMSSFAFLLRAPVDGPILDGVIEQGSGVLNIRSCRIRWKSEAERKSALPGSMPKANNSIGTFQTRDRTSEEPEDFQNKDGRWPCNIALIHGPTCRQVGETRIEGHKGYPNGPGGSSVQFSQKGTATTRADAWAGHADADGKETIPVWDCQESCPVAVLDRLSGDLPAGVAVRRRSGGNTFGGNVAKPAMADMSYGDRGGASRFYPQFATPWELLDWVRNLIGVPGGNILEEI